LETRVWVSQKISLAILGRNITQVTPRPAQNSLVIPDRELKMSGFWKKNEFDKGFDSEAVVSRYEGEVVSADYTAVSLNRKEVNNQPLVGF